MLVRLPHSRRRAAYVAKRRRFYVSDTPASNRCCSKTWCCPFGPCVQQEVLWTPTLLTTVIGQTAVSQRVTRLASLAHVALWAHLGAQSWLRLCRLRTSSANLLRILEAPPGFEPGMEVLQTHSDPFSNSSKHSDIRKCSGKQHVGQRRDNARHACCACSP